MRPAGGVAGVPVTGRYRRHVNIVALLMGPLADWGQVRRSWRPRWPACAACGQRRRPRWQTGAP